MGYTNSSLVNYTRISPNRTSGRDKIDTITIHCVVGQCSVETLGSIFAQSSKQASSNYGVGYDGRIGMYVEEKDRSWCTSSSYNDRRAITIEVASDTYDPYAVTDAAYQALVFLVADICKRNGIKKLVWSDNKNERMNHLNGVNMTCHRDYANKACPGNYLYSLEQKIANYVNDILDGKIVMPGEGTDDPAQTVEPTPTYPVLKKGSYGTWTEKLQTRLQELGYPLGNYGVDKSFGDATVNAVKLFQKANGLEADGIVGTLTWIKLMSSDAVKYVAPVVRPVLNFASKDSDNVVILQKALIAAGYSVGSDGPDGKFGYNTRAAVIRFQRDNGLYIDGVVGAKTWAKLEPYIK